MIWPRPPRSTPAMPAIVAVATTKTAAILIPGEKERQAERQLDAA